MKWRSNENPISLQQKTELEKVIDEHRELMQMPKKRYKRMIKTVHYGVDWEVKNSEGKDSGVLEHKVWNLGRMQLNNDKDNVAYGKLGRMQLRGINVSL